MEKKDERERRRRREAIRRKNARRRQVQRQIATLITIVSLVVLIFVVKGISHVRAEKQLEEQKQQELQIQQAKKEAEAKKQAEQKKKEEAVQTTMSELQDEVEKLVDGFKGDWSLYIQELEYGNEITVNDNELYPASLIKLYVMAATYENMDQVLETATEYYGSEKKAEKKIYTLLKNMIEISDNESYNELLKLQSSSRNITEACATINNFLKENGYKHTEVHTTLVPAYSAFQKDGLGANTTSVSDCGKLLKSIYEGKCVSEESSESMLNFLKNQKNDLKIANGIPEGIKIANKTGETDTVQHDAAIVYGEERDFIICIMTDNIPGAGIIFNNMQELVETVYETLNTKGI